MALEILLLVTVWTFSQPPKARDHFDGITRKASLALRLPDLEDSLAIKRIGRISVNSNGSLLAVEVEEGILIFSTARPFAQERALNGKCPRWAPDGHALGFYSDVIGKRQLALWHPDSDAVEQVTDLSDGISSNPENPGGLGDSSLFTWSPDSTMIAFSTRRMAGYELLGKSEPQSVRVFTGGSTLSLTQLDGVFHTDYTDYLFGARDGSRTRAIERHPEFGLNKLFVLNVRSKRLYQLTRDNQHFSPTWSPDARTVAAVVNVENHVHPLSSAHTDLSLFDVATGSERRIAVPFPIIGTPLWSADGNTIAMLCKKQYFGFTHIELYSVRDGRWSSVTTPQGTAATSIRWASDNHSLLVRTSSRFVDTLWLIDPRNSEANQIDTNNLSLSFLNEGIDQDLRGDIFFAANGPSFVGQIFERAARNAEPLRQLYDANPQLSTLRFGRQRRVTWTDGAGDEVDGIVIFPPDYEPHRRYPLIVDVYPRAAKDELHLSYGGMGQLEAARGYIVFLPDLRAPHVLRTYRGDERYNARARGAEGIPVLVDDFNSGVEYLNRQGFADPNRVGIFGHSNGGYAANLLITETRIPRCAVVGSGRSDLIFDRYFYPDLRYWIDQIRDVRGDVYSKDSFQEFVRMSPLFRMNKVQVPVFMYVGDRDVSWLPEMLMEFNALRQLGKEVTLVRYSEEEHSVVRPNNVRDLVGRIHAFFDRNLRPHDIK